MRRVLLSVRLTPLRHGCRLGWRRRWVLLCRLLLKQLLLEIPCKVLLQLFQIPPLFDQLLPPLFQCVCFVLLLLAFLLLLVPGQLLFLQLSLQFECVLLDLPLSCVDTSLPVFCLLFALFSCHSVLVFGHCASHRCCVVVRCVVFVVAHPVSRSRRCGGAAQ